MTRHFRHILSLAAVSAAFFSCTSMDMVHSDAAIEEGRIIITGTVSDLTDSTPIEDIRIVFEAHLHDSTLPEPVDRQTEYTGSDGIYTIHASGFYDALTCTVTAEDENGIYKEASKEINVTWNGTAYDRETGTFVVNDCNFHLEKR